MRLPSLARRVALLALLALAAVGCTSTGGSATSGAPRFGRILFRDPRPRAGVAVAIMYESPLPGSEAAKEAEKNQDSPGVRSIVGGGGWDPGRDPAPLRETQSETRRIDFFPGSVIPVHLSPDEFAALWEKLEETGIFELPPFPGESPPAGEAAFLFDSGDDRRLVVQPGRGNQLTVDEVQQREKWAKAKWVVISGETRDVRTSR